MAFPTKNGTATRAVALDLMLRTFMNSADFQPYNPRVWESVAKLVPGTTPQQCIRRWEELRATNRVPQRDLSTLSAKGRPISAQDRRQTSSAHVHQTDTYLLPTATHTKMIHAQESAPHMLGGGRGIEGELPPLYSNEPLSRPISVCDSRPASRLSTGSGYRLQGGKFAASFCQTHLSSAYDTRGIDTSDHELGTEERRRTSERFKSSEQRRDVEQELASGSPVGRDNSATDIRSECSFRSLPSSASTVSTLAGREPVQTPPPPPSLDTTKGKSEPLMVIHVHDEAKKINKDFMCTREVLVREMRYFSNYLSSPESQQWEEVDISVHCDVNVFEWLMTYTKQGMMEGPTGEKLTQPLTPPLLEPGNVVAVLISSDFLKMVKLVEECLAYCHAHMSEIIASPSNMNCIGSSLLSRLAKLYSPLEVEDIADPKDKVKSKLYQQMLQRMFNHSYTHPQCPTNAATLFKCQHCGKIMTNEQSTVLHCLPHRVTVNKSGQLVHKHDRSDQWDVSQYLRSLRSTGTSWRALYWRMWGVINWLVCAKCGQTFQCSNLHTCPYHPDTTKLTTELGGAGGVRSTLRYGCCGQPETSFSPMALKQSGCCYRQHTVMGDTTSSDCQRSVYHTLMRVKELVCPRQSGPRSSSSSSSHSRPEAYLLKSEQRERQYQCMEVKSRHQYTQPVPVTKEIPSPIASTPPSLPHHSPKVNGRKQFRKVHQRHQVMDEDGEDSDGSDSDSSPSEVEEDEVDTLQNVHTSNTQRKKKSKKTRIVRTKTADRALAPEAAAVVPPHNWLWDCSKSNRLNQDLQRYSDEQRIDQLSEQLRTDPSFTRSTQYAGGIYCRIEAQFRSQVITATKSSANNSRSSRKKS